MIARSADCVNVSLAPAKAASIKLKLCGGSREHWWTAECKLLPAAVESAISANYLRARQDSLWQTRVLRDAHWLISDSWASVRHAGRLRTGHERLRLPCTGISSLSSPRVISPKTRVTRPFFAGELRAGRCSLRAVSATFAWPARTQAARIGPGCRCSCMRITRTALLKRWPQLTCWWNQFDNHDVILA